MNMDAKNVPATIAAVRALTLPQAETILPAAASKSPEIMNPLDAAIRHARQASVLTSMYPAYSPAAGRTIRLERTASPPDSHSTGSFPKILPKYTRHGSAACFGSLLLCLYNLVDADIKKIPVPVTLKEWRGKVQSL
jgi:hypothetical protein